MRIKKGLIDKQGKIFTMLPRSGHVIGLIN